jgi:polyphosphate kinase
VQSLLEAVDRGKQVAAVLELQARGDEERNIDWAQTLERAGAHVSYGVIGLKTHAKLSLVVRRESGGLRRYVHVGTGNYSAVPYADLSLFTCHPAIGADATALFNVLTGHSRQDHYGHLMVAPVGLRRGLLARIAREIEAHRADGGGHLIFKTNALVDLEVVDALYEASRAGVRVDLIVRGMCCLRPGAPGLSETIRVVSIVGRFLEHSRVYYFRNRGRADVLIGSADLMERNLDRRVEVLVPVLDAGLADALKVRLLDLQLSDTVRAVELHADGIYRSVPPGVPRRDAQFEWTAPDATFME